MFFFKLNMGRTGRRVPVAPFNPSMTICFLSNRRRRIRSPVNTTLFFNDSIIMSHVRYKVVCKQCSCTQLIRLHLQSSLVMCNFQKASRFRNKFFFRRNYTRYSQKRCIRKIPVSSSSSSEFINDRFIAIIKF